MIGSNVQHLWLQLHFQTFNTTLWPGRGLLRTLSVLLSKIRHVNPCILFYMAESTELCKQHQSYHSWLLQSLSSADHGLNYQPDIPKIHLWSSDCPMIEEQERFRGLRTVFQEPASSYMEGVTTIRSSDFLPRGLQGLLRKNLQLPIDSRDTHPHVYMGYVSFAYDKLRP